MSPNQILLLHVGAVIGVLAVVYAIVVGWRRQPTPAAKDVYIMKWFQLAQLIAPIIGVVVPGAGPLIPFIVDGIARAQSLHGEQNSDAKKQLVFQIVADGAAATSATGKLTIDPMLAIAVTNAVFNAADSVHAVVKANRPAPVPTPAVPPAV